MHICIQKGSFILPSFIPPFETSGFENPLDRKVDREQQPHERV